MHCLTSAQSSENTYESDASTTSERAIRTSQVRMWRVWVDIMKRQQMPQVAVPTTALNRLVRGQIAQLLDFVRECVPAGDVSAANIILAGDWNIDAHAHRAAEKCALSHCSLGRCVCTYGSDDEGSGSDGASPEYHAMIAQLRVRVHQSIS